MGENLSAIHPSQFTFFEAHAPFDRMEHRHLQWMLEHMQVAYYEAGEIILTPAQGSISRFFVIKQGAVHGEQEIARTDEQHAWLELVEGECFPLGALLSSRPVASVYRAASDTFCYEMAAVDFNTLLEMSAPFRDFCTRRIANLLEHSKSLIQARYTQSSAEQQSLTSPLAALISRAPVTCTESTTVREALEMMQHHRVGSIVAVDSEFRPAGILTLQDVLTRVALPQVDLAQPVLGIMSRELTLLAPQAQAHEAAMIMAQYGMRHVLLVENGRLTGVVSEKDLFSLQRIGLRQLSLAIRHAENLGELRRSAADIHQMAHNMMAQGVPPEQLTQFISTLNDLLTMRIIELEFSASELAGTEMLASVCWIALGSEGRFEQTLKTDQDNGLIFEVPNGLSAQQVREKLLPVAARINIALAECGFPLCNGKIMASNPQWCLSLQEWKQVFAGWVENGTPKALMHASIFFDFRALYGKAGLADTLRTWLMGEVKGKSRFLYQMAEIALQNRPPLGLVRDFVVSREKTIDLKLNGITPFVDAARIFSLAAGVTATNTVSRLRASAEQLRFRPMEVDAWVDALLFIQVLRLRHHDELSEQGMADTELDNRIDPSQLNELDRRILKEAFRQARKLQSRLAMEYQQ